MSNPQEVPTRYLIIDFLHICHRFIKLPPLSAPVKINGVIEQIDTTIPTHAIKAIWNMSGRGRHLTAVCLEGERGAKRRKEYFAQLKDGKDYKGGRPRKENAFFRGVDLSVNLMHQGGVSLFKDPELEADDCVYSLVQKIKQVDQITPIDVLTNDSDLLPLVDDQVSVYMRGNRGHAEPGRPEFHLYYQVTPETWDEYLEMTSAYGKYTIPYNSMILFKLIRGDKADNIDGALDKFGPVKYNALMEQMLNDGVDFSSVFRYENDFDEVIRPVLENYFEKETVDYMQFVFNGISPFYSNFNIPSQIQLYNLQKALLPLAINLPV